MSKGRYYIVEVYEDGTANYTMVIMDRAEPVVKGQLWSPILNVTDSLKNLLSTIIANRGE